MSISTSVLSDLLNSLPHLRPQLYFKASLTALSHAMEDQVLAANLDSPLIIASFQQERFYRQEAHRYQRLAEKNNQIYVKHIQKYIYTCALFSCSESCAHAPSFF